MIGSAGRLRHGAEVRERFGGIGRLVAHRGHEHDAINSQSLAIADVAGRIGGRRLGDAAEHGQPAFHDTCHLAHDQPLFISCERLVFAERPEEDQTGDATCDEHLGVGRGGLEIDRAIPVHLSRDGGKNTAPGGQVHGEVGAGWRDRSFMGGAKTLHRRGRSVLNGLPENSRKTANRTISMATMPDERTMIFRRMPLATTPSQIRACFFAEIGEPLLPPEQLFDDLPDVVFFIKDAAGRYVVINQTLADRCSRGDKCALVGKRPQEVYPAELASHYEHQDAHVLKSGRSVSRRLELHIYSGGGTGWCLTSKFPLRGRGGRIAGIAGISRDLSMPGDRSSGYRELAGAILRMQSGFAENLRIGDLASMARMSVHQFEQRIRRLFQMTPLQLLHKLRIEEATRLLRDTSLPVSEIALNVGYCDQSAFTRFFRKFTGIPPARFRTINER